MNSEEIKMIFENAKAQGACKVTIGDVSVEFSKTPDVPQMALNASEAVSLPALEDEFTEEEIRFAHSDYFEELQLQKELHKQKLKEEGYIHGQEDPAK